MNIVSLIGRLTRDPEVRWSNDLAIARFSLAVDRVPGRDGQERGADFPSIVVFGKQAENCERYLVKGRKVAIQGHIQTGSYEKDGRKVYTTDIVADRVEFLEWGDRPAAQSQGSSQQSAGSNLPEGFVSIDDDEDLPF